MCVGFLSSADVASIVQGFDKYGVWRVDALAAPKLRAALDLKVSRVHTSQRILEVHLPLSALSRGGTNFTKSKELTVYQGILMVAGCWKGVF